jgi:hypothetical protein
MKFIISTLIFLFLWLPVVLIGMLVTPFMLQPRWHWDGKTTWFGNRLYGRMGNAHTPINPTMFDQWYFLAIRNPVSNFGEEVLSVSSKSSWPWFIDKQVFKTFYILYGWKNPRDENAPFREFVFRPWFHK